MFSEDSSHSASMRTEFDDGEPLDASPSERSGENGDLATRQHVEVVVPDCAVLQTYLAALEKVIQEEPSLVVILLSSVLLQVCGGYIRGVI